MSATNDRVANPGLLTSASNKSAPMDVKHMRKTEDGKVSVLDVIAQMKNCTQHYASKMYRRLVEEERVPDCEIRSLMSAKCGRQNRSHYPTPVASAAEITQIIWQLPGASEFRKNCANVCVRYLGGLSLVDEISKTSVSKSSFVKTTHPILHVSLERQWINENQKQSNENKSNWH